MNSSKVNLLVVGCIGVPFSRVPMRSRVAAHTPVLACDGAQLCGFSAVVALTISLGERSI